MVSSQPPAQYLREQKQKLSKQSTPPKPEVLKPNAMKKMQTEGNDNSKKSIVMQSKMGELSEFIENQEKNDMKDDEFNDIICDEIDGIEFQNDEGD